MELSLFLQILVLIVGFYMAWNIGANDVSNAMGTSVGSGALSLRKAVCLAAVLEFAGAFLVGGDVSETMQRGLIDTHVFASEPMLLILGMCSALVATGAWLQIASYCGWPVSTTHAIVGSIVGFGFVIGGYDAVHWDKFLPIVFSWILSPLISGLISYGMFGILQKKILYALNPIEATKRLYPFLVFTVFFVFSSSLIFNGLDNLPFSLSFFGVLLLASAIGLIAAGIAGRFMKKIQSPQGYPTSSAHPQTIVSLEKAAKHLQRVQSASGDNLREEIAKLTSQITTLAHNLKKESHFPEKTSEYSTVERMFIYLQILSACFVAFAHGANDVANAIGPVAAVLEVIKQGTIPDIGTVPPWLLAFGGFGIVFGLATWGWRVIETIGKKITELTPTRGFCAEFGAATTILLASKLGIPLSTTHCLVGSVLGIGMAKGIRAINLGMIKEIVLSWIITIPASAGMSILVFYLLKASLSYFFPEAFPG